MHLYIHTSVFTQAQKAVGVYKGDIRTNNNNNGTHDTPHPPTTTTTTQGGGAKGGRAHEGGEMRGDVDEKTAFIQLLKEVGVHGESRWTQTKRNVEHDARCKVCGYCRGVWVSC